MGMALPGTSGHAATSREDYRAVTPTKREDCARTVEALFNLMEKGIHARDIITAKSLENSVMVIYAVGGSTNAFLHLLAIAHEAEISQEEPGRPRGITFPGSALPADRSGSGSPSW